MQSLPVKNCKWVMMYQDHLTKFCALRPITSKREAEVVYHLMDLFLLLTAPVILQSDTGSEFTTHVVTELKDVWLSLKIVHGRPCHPHSQGSVGRANSDIKDMLTAWLADNTGDWTIGVKFVQFQMNSNLHAGINHSPYKALFGCPTKIGLTSFTLPDDITERLETEDELLRLVSNPT
ncbi:KRAB-A domain-containing protein 2-like [Macrobrachium rosenbergii]|uniref:KRAB-A domain-containing protein 2-like n=1 Tax=Macrobrachium rosenbergii TaxID=79674 RepID=UPI0034D6AE0E